MPYDPATQPRTLLPNEYLGATQINREVIDLLRFAIFEKAPQVLLREGVADYTTSANAWVDVDAANLIRTVSCKTTKLIAWATFDTSVNLSAVAGAYDLTLNGTRVGGTYGLLHVDINQRRNVIVGPYIWTNVANGTYTIKLQYRSFAAQPVTIYNNGYPIVFVATDAW